MIAWEMVRLAWLAMNARKLRTLLTMLGIVVGVGSVIVMLAYGEGQKRELLKRFEGYGERMLSVRFSYHSWRGTLTVPRSIQLKYNDIQAIREQCSAVSNALASARLNCVVRRGDVTLEDDVSTFATEPGYFGIAGDKFADGRPFSYDENLGQERVCVLGSQTKERLFYAAPAVDDYIQLDGKRYRVCGVLMPKSSGQQNWYDERIFVPWNTAVERLHAVANPNEIIVEAVSEARVELASRQIRELLHTRYPSIPMPEDIFNEDESPIRIRSTQSRMEDREQAADSFAILLRVIGGLSLLIGGVGVMNIMLVNVQERTREIGLRKAVGATHHAIRNQFLLESVVLCMLGGAVGTGSAWLTCEYLKRLPAEAQVPDPIITPLAIAVAVVVTIGVGIFFGVYPAAHAASLDPINSLRSK